MPFRTMKNRGRAAALPAAASLLLLAGAAPAFAGDQTDTVELRQELPRTATSDNGGVPQEGRDGCPGIPDGKDGWHFVLKGNSTDFVSLTVTFEPGGQQVLTEFGPPSEKHAYVASEPGARLVSAQAEVEGEPLELFNLSHTCPAGTTPTTPGGEPTEEPTEEPSEEPTGEPTDEPATDESKSPAGSPEPSAPESSDASPAPAGGGEDGVDGEDGDLAATGAGAPIGALAAGAAVLVGAGGYLALRRRKATAGQD